MRFKELIQGLDEKPGVYFMLGKQDKYLYIGKAKNLKKRLSQYFASTPKLRRTQRMLSYVVDVQVMITQSESAALLLESELIKKHQPPYNILLKDDKSHPYLVLSKHDYPAMKVGRYRKSSIPDGVKLFGPYPHVSRVSTMLDWIQRIFRLRNCSDHFFASRKRPCIQYEIGRCSAPCVDLVDRQAYLKDVKMASNLLSGKGYKVRKDLMERMYAYAESEHYERAAACRDALRTFASAENRRATDKMTHVFYYEEVGDVMHITIAQFIGDQIDDISHELVEIHNKCAPSGWLSGYIFQYYEVFTKLPDQICVLDRADVEVLSEWAGKSIKVTSLKDVDAVFTDVTAENMQQYRSKKTVGSLDWSVFWQSLSEYMGQSISQMVCFDVSHHSGQYTYASCVVASLIGLDRKKFRLYKLDTNGDDYLALSLAVKRWVAKADLDGCLVIIDGGVGQIKAAMDELPETAMLTSIAKGAARQWGKERFFRTRNSEVEQFSWPPELMRTILFLRDQAHDHAISAHRKASRKAAFRSQLDDIPGLGRAKKKALLGYFGGLAGVKQASLEQLQKAPQIGAKLAQRIYDALKLC